MQTNEYAPVVEPAAKPNIARRIVIGVAALAVIGALVGAGGDGGGSWDRGSNVYPTYSHGYGSNSGITPMLDGDVGVGNGIFVDNNSGCSFVAGEGYSC